MVVSLLTKVAPYETIEVVRRKRCNVRLKEEWTFPPKEVAS